MAVDRDRSGSVSLPELHHALTHGGYVSFSIKTARLLLRMYDADRSGSLSYYEFERLMGQLTQWKGFFDAHTAGTGRLSPGGLAAIVAASGFALPPPIVHMMFYAYDENASGTLSFVRCARPAEAPRRTQQPRPTAPRNPPPPRPKRHAAHHSPAPTNGTRFPQDEYIQVHSELTTLTAAFRRHDPSSCGRATLDFTTFLGLVFGSRS
jgi:Ca2+-binding EF-hand superfamily protein